MSTMPKPNVETAQEPFEFERLLAIIEEADPLSILEIGVWHGGTLWHWLQQAPLVVGVDDTMFEADTWHQWARDADAELHLWQGSSHDEGIVRGVTSLGPYDVVFIDADHTYESVRADWENYGPLAKHGGLVVFHDIAPRQFYGVNQLWNEIKPGRRTVEIWGGVDSYCGIGVLWV